MRTERKIEALREATERKRQEALDKTNAAITRLLKEGKRINFPTVAKEAGVSVTYLYKYEEIKERIYHLRKQQEASIEKPINPQTASDKSKQVIINQFREKIKQLESDNKELRNKNEAVYGRLHQLQGAQQERELLKLEIDRLKIENNRLKQQLDECNQKLQSATLIDKSPKVIPLDREELERADSKNNIKTLLQSLEIQLNSTLSKVIKSASEETVLDAIEALKEVLADGSVEKPAAWLKSAIEKKWKPNGKIQSKPGVEVFNEWYSKAKKKRLIQASQNTKDGIMIYTKENEWIPFEQMLIRYPLNTL